METPTKKYRASIYIDIEAKTRDEAVMVANRIADHLAVEELTEDIEGTFFAPYVGGAGEVVASSIETYHNLKEI